MLNSFKGNWVDLVIIVILLYYVFEAFRYGLWSIVIDFVSFLGSLLLSLFTYKYIATLLKSNFNLPLSFANAFGFVVSAILLEIILGYMFTYLIRKLPKKVLEFKYNKFIALIPSLGEGLILVAFLLTAVIALPVLPQVKKDVTASKIGRFILKETSGLEAEINKIFGGVVNDSLTYFTIEPKSNQTINLGNGIDHLSYDHESETKMFSDVNNERTNRGLTALTWSPKIVGVAEAYAWDMWVRHYFSHYNPEGKTVADRFTATGISWTVVGENLALAPTEATAMTGLMNSPEHKANILDTQFHTIGIGVVDNGIYGKIFVQEFSN